MQLPPAVREACAAIVAAPSAARSETAAAWSAADTPPPVAACSATLPQLAATRRIGPGPWMCDEEGCGITQDLWCVRASLCSRNFPFLSPSLFARSSFLLFFHFALPRVTLAG